MLLTRHPNCELGKTGLRVSAISLGLWEIGGDAWRPVEDADPLAVIRRAWELGVDFFDTADVYGRGRSEELLARFLKTVPRDRVYVATKVGLWGGGRLARLLQASEKARSGWAGLGQDFVARRRVVAHAGSTNEYFVVASNPVVLISPEFGFHDTSPRAASRLTRRLTS